METKCGSTELRQALSRLLDCVIIEIRWAVHAYIVLKFTGKNKISVCRRVCSAFVPFLYMGFEYCSVGVISAVRERAYVSGRLCLRS